MNFDFAENSNFAENYSHFLDALFPVELILEILIY